MAQNNLDPISRVTFGRSVTRPAEIESRTIQETMNRIATGEWRVPIEAIRRETDPAARKEMKLRLPYFVFAILKNSRCEENVVQANGVILDFDALPDIEAARSKLIQLPWALWVFRSPVDGLKVVIPFSRAITDKSEYARIWTALTREVEDSVGLTPDNTPDMSRACFVSWDADLVQKDGEPLDIDALQEAIPAPQAPPQIGETPEVYASGPTEAQAKSAVEFLAARKLEQRDWIRCGIALYNHFGEDGIVYWLQFAYNPNYSDTPEQLRKVWERLKKYPGVGIGTLFFIAEQQGWINALAPRTDTEPSPPAVKIPDSEAPAGALLTIDDYPELLELFRRPQNIPLERDRLPGVFNHYLETVDRITDAQDGAKLTAMLPVAASSIGNRVFMYNAGTNHYCNIWAAIIGPSTVSRKTTVINQAMKMLKPFKDSLRDLSAKERNQQDIELSRVTQARLYNLLAINPNRLILQMELSAWMQEMGKSYNAGMKQELTDMFDGKDRSIAKMEIDEYIRKPAFSIVGATTEDWFFQELREVADQRGGFLQRFIICIIQNIDVCSLRLESVDSSGSDEELYAWGEMLETFRALPGSHRLYASEEAREFRDAIYRKLMTAIALNANDPQAAYCARIFDNYFWRFCILIYLMKNWGDLREANGTARLPSWFEHNRVDRQTAEQAWYLCDYYYRNTRPFLEQLMDNNRMEEEKNILKILQKAPDQEMTHSRLLCKSRMVSRDFRKSIESLIERQAIISHEKDSGYKNRVSLRYCLNPVLDEIDIS